MTPPDLPSDVPAPPPRRRRPRPRLDGQGGGAAPPPSRRRRSRRDAGPPPPDPAPTGPAETPAADRIDPSAAATAAPAPGPAGGTANAVAAPGLPEIFAPARRPVLVRLAANGVVQAAAAFAVPLALATPGPAALGPVAAAGLLAAVGLGLIALRAAEFVDAERLGQSFVAESRMALYDALMAAPRAGAPGVAMARLMGDLTALRNWVGLGLVRGAVALVTLAGAVAAAAVLAGPLAWAVAAPVALVLALAAALLVPLQARVARVRQVRGRLANRLARALARRDAALAAGRDPRTGSGAPRARSRVQRASDDLGQALAGRMRLIGLLRAAPEGVVPLAVAGALVSAGAAPGAAEVGIVVLAGLAAGPLRVLARAVEYRVAYVVARDRLAPAFDGPPGEAGD